jgi:iron complex outermembrane recepter protein
VLDADALGRRAAGSLGETLNGLPGISSTYFGPNASRPNIRGQEGDRIRILNNSGSSFDASSLSFDHAVPVNPINLERVEVLRGPASLLFGGNAIGGVINLNDRRIPRFDPVDGDGLKQRIDLSGASADRLASVAGSVDSQQGRVAWHLDFAKQRREPIKVPIVLDCEKQGVVVQGKQICNSQSKAGDVGIGSAVKLADGHVGLSLAQYKTQYGSPAQTNVSIDMRTTQLRLEGQHGFNQSLGLQNIQWQIGRVRYQHQELDEGVVGTLFKNRGIDSRLELRYKASLNNQGVIGLQTEHSDFAAIGDEAFLPPSKTKSIGTFVVHDWNQPWGRLSAGLRVDRVKIQPASVQSKSAARQFSPVNIALGGVFKFNPSVQVSLNLSSGQRAPKDYELFADGPHIATNAYEIGAATLAIEKYRSADFGVRFKAANSTIKANLFTTRFSNYIALNPQPTIQAIDGLPVYTYAATPARFNGFEVEWDAALSNEWLIKARSDKTIATNLAGGQPLPRIAPLCLGLSLAWQPSNHWTLDIGLDHNAAQTRVPENALTTRAFTLLNASANRYLCFNGGAQSR